MLIEAIVSGRLVCDNAGQKLITESRLKTLWSWISDRSSYKEANKKANNLYWKCLKAELGKTWASRGEDRANISLKNNLEPLTQRRASQILIYSKYVHVGDVENLKQVKDITEIAGVELNPLSTKQDLVGGCPSKFTALLFHDREFQLRELESCFDRIKELVAEKEMDRPKFIEMLAKNIIYREMNVGTLVPAPSKKDGSLVYYRVDKCVATGLGGTAAYLKPVDTGSDEDPIIVFCGSQFHPSGLDTLSCYKSDCDPELGAEAYISLGEFVQEVNGDLGGKPVIVAGHSLGSALGQRYVAENPGNVSLFESFNGPGVPKEVDEHFTQVVEGEGYDIKINIHQTEGDLVSFGGHHLGLDLLKKGKDSTMPGKGVEITLIHYSKPRWRIGELFKNIIRPHTYLCQTDPLGMDITATPYSKREAIIDKLDTVKHERVEFIRGKIVGTVVAPILGAIRTVSRAIFGKRKPS